jgi:hypothetical protein
MYNNQPYVNAASLKIADQILAEYYGLLEYRGFIMDYCGILWIIAQFVHPNHSCQP